MPTYRSFIDDMDPLAYYGYFTDFMEYFTADWILTTTEAGAGAATEVISSTLRGGVLVCTLDNADNDTDFFQLAGGTGAVIEPYLFVTGKKLRFVMRFKINEVVQSDFVAGLYVTDTDPITAIVDGMYFSKADGEATLKFNLTKNSTTTTVTVGTLVADTFHTIEFYYNGSTMAVYFDGVKVAKPALTNVPDDENVTLGFGMQAGEATNVKVLSVDYVGAWQER